MKFTSIEEFGEMCLVRSPLINLSLTYAMHVALSSYSTVSLLLIEGSPHDF